MTLGQRIAQYRKAAGLSQETLGERVGVSRQAVSKWETDAAAPDMENLIALARIFGVSLAELTETPEPPETQPVRSSPRRARRPLWLFLGCLLALVLIMMGIYLWSNRNVVPSEEAVADPSLFPATDFALLWTDSNGYEEFLELGVQEDFFPFGRELALTEPETITDSSFPGDTYHDAVCGDISLRYSVLEGTDGNETALLRMLETASRSYHTPRGITVGSTDAEIIDAYPQIDLIYCVGTSGPNTTLPYEDFYVYCPSSSEDPAFGWNLIFLLSGGHVIGIRMEDASYPYYHVNHLDAFPVKDGAPDFSEQQERPSTTEQQVYDALNALVIRQDLTAEELYTYRWTIFAGLSELDWWAFGDLGATEHRDDTIAALLTWIREQAPYSDAEIFRLQMGVQSNLDGWLADSYSGLLSTALFENPVAFVQGLAYEGLEETMSDVVWFTAYDAELYPVELQTALDTLDAALADGSLTQAEQDWAKLLRLYLTTPLDERSELPKTPEETE